MFNLTKIFGDANEKYIKSLNPLLDKIDSLELEFSKLDKEDFPKKQKNLRIGLKKEKLWMIFFQRLLRF